MRYGLPVFLFVLLLLCGCGGRRGSVGGAEGTRAAPAGSATASREDGIGSAGVAQLKNAELIAESGRHFDAELAKKSHQRDGLPPVVISRIQILDTNDAIDTVDAERSWMFRKSMVERCYGIALVRKPDARGSINLALSNGGTDTAVIERLETDIDVEDFESCLGDVIGRWPLPARARIELRIDLESKPAPSLEELKRMNDDHH